MFEESREEKINEVIKQSTSQICKSLEDLQSVLGKNLFGEKAIFEMLSDESPGICMNFGCDYITKVDPKTEHGYCEDCETSTVLSLFHLMEFI